jgi:hypothetical protein
LIGNLARGIRVWRNTFGLRDTVQFS